MPLYIQSVLHIHEGRLWHELKHKLPTAPIHAEYGSQELCMEIRKVCKAEKGLTLLEGHWPGLIAYGRDLEHAISEILKFC